MYRGPYLRVRPACHVEGMSQRGAASRFGIVRETVKKMLRHSEPPGCRRWQPPKRPKLVLEEDRTVHRKQRHTAKQIFECLRDEMVLGLRSGTAPSSPGDDRGDGACPGGLWRGGCVHRRCQAAGAFFAMDLPHSAVCFTPAAAAEAWLDGHNSTFVFFGGARAKVAPKRGGRKGPRTAYK